MNLGLICVPGPCIDYVVLHELCHLKVHNHGKAFYRLLDMHMPDWRAVKGRLTPWLNWHCGEMPHNRSPAHSDAST